MLICCPFLDLVGEGELVFDPKRHDPTLANGTRDVNGQVLAVFQRGSQPTAPDPSRKMILPSEHKWTEFNRSKQRERRNN